MATPEYLSDEVILVGTSLLAPTKSSMKKWPAHPRWPFFYDVLMAVNIEVEVFVLHLLLRAVGANVSDGGVESVRQLFIALAHGNAGTAAEVLGVFIGRANKREAWVALAMNNFLRHIDPPTAPTRET
ncbi:hypothetical protein J3D54_005497 [Pseudomonas sp. GGS8]|nr:hypothetical protein [Pseudomonas sp. GGS8]